MALRIRTIADLENAPRNDEGRLQLRNANLQLADLQGANLQDAYLNSANLQGANLTGANLFNADLTRADFEGAILRDANLEGTNLTGARLFNTDLQNANLRGANITGARLEQTDLQVAANLEGVIGIFADELPAANNIIRIRTIADLDNVTRLRNRGYRGYNLRGADLHGADLHGANLQSADIREGNLRGVNLRNAILQGADLQGADLQGANLQGVFMNEANLQGANLQGANFTGANGRGVNFTGANFTGVIGLTQDIIERFQGRPGLQAPRPPAPQPPVPRPQIPQEPQGIAHEVHLAFRRMNIADLTNFLKTVDSNGSGPIDTSMVTRMDGPIFLHFVKYSIDTFLSEINNEEYRIPMKPTGYYPPGITTWKTIWDAIYQSRIVNLPFTNQVKEIIFLSLIYAGTQPSAFKINYVISYLDEAAFAYTSGFSFDQNFSCGKGLQERFVTALVPAIDTILTGSDNISEQKKIEYKTLRTKIKGGFDVEVAKLLINEWQENNKNIITENSEFRANKDVLVQQQRDHLIHYLCCELGTTQEDLMRNSIIQTTIDYMFGDDNILDNSLGGKRRKRRQTKKYKKIEKKRKTRNMRKVQKTKTSKRGKKRRATRRIK